MTIVENVGKEFAQRLNPRAWDSRTEGAGPLSRTRPL